MARYENVVDQRGKVKQTHPIYGAHDPDAVEEAVKKGTGEYVLMQCVTKRWSWDRPKGGRRRLEEHKVTVYVHRDDVEAKRKHGFYEVDEDGNRIDPKSPKETSSDAETPKPSRPARRVVKG